MQTSFEGLKPRELFISINILIIINKRMLNLLLCHTLCFLCCSNLSLVHITASDPFNHVFCWRGATCYTPIVSSLKDDFSNTWLPSLDNCSEIMLAATDWHCKNSSKCYQSFFLWSCLPLNVESSFGHLLANSLWDKEEKKFIYISSITDITIQITCSRKIPLNILT